MTDYTKTGNPISGARGISKNVRDEFALIETAVNSKANIASPTFTGTPKAPTAAAGTAGTQIATVDFCNALSFASVLPAQTGNSGKFVKTDGSSASWQMAIPLQTGHSGKVLTTNGTTESWGYPQIRRSARTSNTMLSTDDHAHFIDITSGTFSQTFDACATLAVGWWCIIRNSGTGDITLDPNSTEFIDAVSTTIMYPNEVRMITCNGTSLDTAVLSPFYKTFTSSDTFTKPTRYSLFEGMAWGGGSSGSRSGGAGGADGGGGAACNYFVIPASALSATTTVTVGSGGTASTGAINAGGNTTFGSLITAYGSGGQCGAGLLSGGASTAGGEPDAESSTTYHYFGGGDGSTSGDGESSYMGGGAGGGGSGGVGSGVGGNSVYGSAGGGGVSSAGATKAGGTSVFGGNGGASGDAVNGTNGSAPGGGGGATRTGATAGAGARGELRIWGIV